MNNPLKTTKTLSDNVVDSVSEASQKNMQKALDESKAALDKGVASAKQIRQSRAIKMIEQNPVRTIGIIAVLGFAAYSIFARKND